MRATVTDRFQETPDACAPRVVDRLIALPRAVRVLPSQPRLEATSRLPERTRLFPFRIPRLPPCAAREHRCPPLLRIRPARLATAKARCPVRPQLRRDLLHLLHLTAASIRLG